MSTESSPHAFPATVDAVLALFRRRGDDRYGLEDVSQQQHALQCADLARQEDADEDLIASALLHDIGHLLSGDDLPTRLQEDLNDRHESAGARWLSSLFPRSVVDPIRMHVAAKRYLCTREPGYVDRLSSTSRKSYEDQGGGMSADALAKFESQSHFNAALKLRRWDDTAKDPEKPTASLEDYRELLCRVASRRQNSTGDAGT